MAPIFGNTFDISKVYQLIFLKGAKLVYKESKPDGVGVIQSLDVGSIRSVKVLAVSRIGDTFQLGLSVCQYVCYKVRIA